jgi:LysR family transcriptional activator of nhaA
VEWLNYHHLLYFWLVAREGGLGPAARILRLQRPTLSAQIHALEESLGQELFRRVGRGLVLTDVGRAVYRYADEIFALGRELQAAVKGGALGARDLRLNVGVADVVPKLVVRRLLAPVWTLAQPVRLVCFEDTHERLTAQLAAHELDVLIADAPLPPAAPVRAYNHLLGESAVALFGAARFAALKRGFPRSLDGVPMLLPLEGAPLRRAIDQWLEATGVRPHIVAEFEDSALLKAFGQSGVGVFAAPAAVEKEVARQYGVMRLGRLAGVNERFYAISAERRIQHPAVAAIQRAASELMPAPRT